MAVKLNDTMIGQFQSYLLVVFGVFIGIPYLSFWLYKITAFIGYIGFILWIGWYLSKFFHTTFVNLHSPKVNPRNKAILITGDFFVIDF